MTSENDPFDQPVEMEIDGELDLHTFRPSELTPLLQDYVDACRERGILSLRLIHGKGKGVLRRTMHAVLERLSEVESYRLDEGAAGGWGATHVVLKP